MQILVMGIFFLAIVSGVALPSADDHIYNCVPVHDADVDDKGDEVDIKDDDNDDDTNYNRIFVISYTEAGKKNKNVSEKK